MKRSTLIADLFPFLNGVFYGSLISFAALAALITAFSLHLPPNGNTFFTPLELRSLLWACIVFSVLFSLCFTLRKVWILVPILLSCYLFYEWVYGTAKKELFDLLYIISKRYDNAYGCGVVLLIDERPHNTDLTIVLRCFAAMGTAIVTWATCKRQSSYWVLLFSLLCFAPCCVMTNTVPAPWALFLLFLSLILFLMTGHVRKFGAQQSALLSLIFVVPVAIATVLLFTLVSPEAYNGKERADALLDYFQNVFSSSDSIFGGTNTRSANSVNLDALGSRQERRIPVMYITAPDSRTYYLRGEIYSRYTGIAWTADSSFTELPWVQSVPTGEIVSIRTRFDHEILYVPYCVDPNLLYTAGPMMHNPDRLKEYQFDHHTLRGNVSIHGISSQYDIEQYWTDLPSATLAWAENFTNQLIGEYYRDIIASMQFDPSVILTVSFPDYDTIAVKAISEFVRSSAVYSLDPPEMDSSYKDFAQWFVEEGEEGYCVHFAATAAVLLRAAGIPARYVSGYMVETTENRETTIYQRNAHAWVEYWDKNYGWQILEVTPSRQGQQPGESSESETTTRPEESTLPIPSTTLPTESEQNIVDTPSAPAGNNGTGSNSGSSAQASPLWSILKWLILVLFLFLLAIVLRILRLRLWQHAYHHASSKDKALRSWNRALSYTKLLKEAPDPKLRSIAEKAKFSQHPISSAELEQFDAFLRASQEKLDSRPIYLRIYGRWILALY